MKIHKGSSRLSIFWVLCCLFVSGGILIAYWSTATLAFLLGRHQQTTNLMDLFENIPQEESLRTLPQTPNNQSTIHCIEQNPNHERETAILITTNWIPSAPSIGMIKEVINSFALIDGLSPKAPTYIVVDHIFPESHRDGKKNKGERRRMEATLEEYSFNLMREYRSQDNVHVIVNKVNHHIGGNLNKTLELLPPETKFLYVIQHDFKFIKPINHTAIIQAMKDHPGRLKHVRFNKKTNVAKRRGDACWKEPDAELRVEGANFTKTSGWSDNNHFSSVEHYKRIIKELGSIINRPLEAPMQHKMYQFPNCSEWAQHVYGAPWQGRHILHLDGRNSWGVI